MGSKIEQREQPRDQIVSRFSPETTTHPAPLAEGTRDVRVQSTKGLRIATRCETVDQFVATFHRYCEDAAIFLPRRCRSVGAVTAFSFDLVDGQSVLSGLGTVVEDFTTASNRFGRPGNLIALQKLGRGSSRVFARVLDAGKAALATVSADETSPPVSRTSTAPIALDARVDTIAPIDPRPAVDPPKPSQRKTHRASTVIGIAAIGKLPFEPPIKAPETVDAPSKKPEPPPARFAAKRAPIAMPVILPLHRTVPAPTAVTPTVRAKNTAAQPAASPHVVSRTATAASARTAPSAVTPKATASIVSANAANATAVPSAVTQTVTAPMGSSSRAPAPSAVTPRATPPMGAANAANAAAVPSGRTASGAVTPTLAAPMVAANAANAAAVPSPVTPTVTAPLASSNRPPAPSAVTPRATPPMGSANAANAAAVPSAVTPRATPRMGSANAANAAAVPSARMVASAVTPTVTASMVAANAANAATVPSAVPSAVTPTVTASMVAASAANAAAVPSAVTPTVTAPMVSSNAARVPSGRIAQVAARTAAHVNATPAARTPPDGEEMTARDDRSVRRSGTKLGLPTVRPVSPTHNAVPEPMAELACDTVREALPAALREALGNGAAVVEVGVTAAGASAPELAAFDGAVSAVTWESPSAAITVSAAQLEELCESPDASAVAAGVASPSAQLAGPTIEALLDAAPVVADIAPVVAPLMASVVTPRLDVVRWNDSDSSSGALAGAEPTIIGPAPIPALPRRTNDVAARAARASVPPQIATAALAARVQPELLAASGVPAASRSSRRSAWFAAIAAFVVVFAVSTVAAIMALEARLPSAQQVANVEPTRVPVVGNMPATTADPGSRDSVPTATVPSAAAAVEPAPVETPAVVPAPVQVPAVEPVSVEAPAVAAVPVLAVAAERTAPREQVVTKPVTPAPTATPTITKTSKSIAKKSIAKKAAPARRIVRRKKPVACSNLDCL